MSWSGDERRENIHICKYEDRILDTSDNVIEIKGDVKNLNTRINGALDSIATHIRQGDSYRKLIIITAISLVAAIAGGIITTFKVSSSIAYEVGKNVQQLEVNTNRLQKIEAHYEEMFT